MSFGGYGDEQDYDEIKRLRDKVDALNSALTTTSEGNARLMEENATLREYLREVAVEAGLPPETLDIASCRHIAHQVKAIREASVTFMNDAATLRQALKNHTEEAAKMVNAEPVAYWNGKGSIIPAEDVSYLPNWSDYYPIPLYRRPQA